MLASSPKSLCGIKIQQLNKYMKNYIWLKYKESLN